MLRKAKSTPRLVTFFTIVRATQSPKFTKRLYTAERSAHTLEYFENAVLGKQSADHLTTRNLNLPSVSRTKQSSTTGDAPQLLRTNQNKMSLLQHSRHIFDVSIASLADVNPVVHSYHTNNNLFRQCPSPPIHNCATITPLPSSMHFYQHFSHLPLQEVKL